MSNDNKVRVAEVAQDVSHGLIETLNDYGSLSAELCNGRKQRQAGVYSA